MITIPQHCTRTETCSTEHTSESGVIHVVMWDFREGNPDLEILNKEEEKCED